MELPKVTGRALSTPPAEPAAPAPVAEPADRLTHPLARNPYAGVAGQAVDAGTLQRYDRPGLAAQNPLETRLAALTSGKKLTGAVDALLDQTRSHRHLEGAIGTMPSGEPIPSVSALFPTLSAPELVAARMRSDAALRDFTVYRADGTEAVSLHDKLTRSGLEPEQLDRVLDAFAIFHHSLGLRSFDRAGSLLNWKHICAEAGQVMDACAKKRLSPETTEDALHASLFSDAVKFPTTLLTHNVDGAIGAYHVLKRFFDERDPAQAARLAGIVQAAREHQIGPPSFMAMICGFQLTGAINRAGLDGAVCMPLVRSIQAKIADPLNAAHVTVDPSGAARIAFTPDEQALLARIELDEWSVPHPDARWFEASMAVITGDSLVNYATPDGVGKIVALSGPGSIFKDPTVFHSMFSCGTSTVDAARVVGADFQGLYETGQRYTRNIIERLAGWLTDQLALGCLPFEPDELDRLIGEEHVDKNQLEIVEEEGLRYVMLPGNGRDVPFVHRPLDYDKPGPDLEIARLIRRKVADMLRDADVVAELAGAAS